MLPATMKCMTQRAGLRLTRRPMPIVRSVREVGSIMPTMFFL